MPNRDGITFTSSQKRGILLLFTVILGIIGITFGVKKYQRTPAVIKEFPEQVYTPPVFQRDTAIRLDINLADTAQFASLPYIGRILSKRIVNYRKSIGGFVEVDQLAKVYGLKKDALDAIRPNLFVNTLTVPNSLQPAKVTKVASRSLTPININTATESAFKQLPGIGEVLSRRIVKYRTSLGGFQHIDQLKNVYQLEENVYDQIKPYLFIKGIAPAALPPKNTDLAIQDLLVEDGKGRTKKGLVRGNQRTAPAFQKATLAIESVNLNVADSMQLVSVPGIGTKLAKRILKYRTLLGFYLSVDQLKSVYGLSDQNYQRMEAYLYVGDISGFKKRNLNTIYTRSLAFYPQIDKSLAESIINRRNELGRFESWEQIEKIEGMTDSVLTQLKAYFHI